jgi:hypothetical protein
LLFTKSPQTNQEHHHAALQNLLSSLQKITADLQDFLADALDSPPTNGAVIATAIRFVIPTTKTQKQSITDPKTKKIQISILTPSLHPRHLHSYSARN